MLLYPPRDPPKSEIIMIKKSFEREFTTNLQYLFAFTHGAIYVFCYLARQLDSIVKSF